MPGPCVELNMTLLMVVTDPSVRIFAGLKKNFSIPGRGPETLDFRLSTPSLVFPVAFFTAAMK